MCRRQTHPLDRAPQVPDFEREVHLVQLLSQLPAQRTLLRDREGDCVLFGRVGRRSSRERSRNLVLLANIVSRLEWLLCRFWRLVGLLTRV